ncbi:MAG: hypothetical protein EKK40_10460 [Bradyrhizobiaceae bacterium]|nr:MAG: hypothetical protein EKK40_10460 [Bradyrhizobiaceae bacterium]
MPVQKPQMTNDDEKRVVPFRPRPAEPRAAQSGTSAPDTQADSQNRADAHRRRQIANLAAALFAVFLTAVGVWLATSLNHMRQVQDCVAMGMRDCSNVSGSAPHS